MEQVQVNTFRPSSRLRIPLGASAIMPALAAVTGIILMSGCVTRVYVIGDPPPDSITILNGTFWRSAGGMDAASVSNSVSGGATIKGALR